MKLSLLLKPRQDRSWQLASQIGITEVISKLAPQLTGIEPPYVKKALELKRLEFAEAGFKLSGLEGDQFDMSRIKEGLAGRDEDLENYCRMIRNAAEAGIELICYNFMAVFGWLRTSTDVPERGGALTTAYRHTDLDVQNLRIGSISETALWENWHYFIKSVLPTAKKYGVKLALHPDDPPISPLKKVGRIFTSAEAFRKAQAITESIIGFEKVPTHGITFCQATFKMMGEDIEAVAREFLDKKWIQFIHLRDVRGDKYDFTETFHDNGPTDMVKMLRLYSEAGFKGLIRPDHCPAMAGETHVDEKNDSLRSGYEMQGRLFAVGYLRGIIDSIYGSVSVIR
jgi:mannonate dehydratase